MPRVFILLALLGLALPAFANEEITEALNAFREGQNRTKVVYSPLLEKAARRHANDMIRRGFFSHTGSNGSSVGKRVRRAGYKWCYVSENLANGHKSFASAFKAWQGSPPHRKNMLNHKAREFGIASGQGGHWVLVLARPC